MNKLLNKRSISITIPENEKLKKIKINIIKSETINEADFNLKIYNIIKKYKLYIEEDFEKWETIKYYTNLFEIITYSNYCKYQKSLTLYEPISRAYFKFWEIICNFNLIDLNKKEYRYSALAEGPGGFVECFINYRKKYFQGKYDKIYCMTLQSEKQNIPDWKRINRFTNKKRHNINILYGQIYNKGRPYIILWGKVIIREGHIVFYGAKL